MPPFVPSSSAEPDPWSGVQNSVSEACQALDGLAAKSNNAPGVGGRLRRAYRTLCASSNTVSCYLDLVPSDMMIASSLRGALQLVFTAMQSSANHRQAIFDALEEIPLVLADRNAVLKIFDTDEALHSRMAALYVEIMGILQHMVQYFTRNSFGTNPLHPSVHPVSAPRVFHADNVQPRSSRTLSSPPPARSR